MPLMSRSVDCNGLKLFGVLDSSDGVALLYASSCGLQQKKPSLVGRCLCGDTHDFRWIETALWEVFRILPSLALPLKVPAYHCMYVSVCLPVGYLPDSGDALGPLPCIYTDRRTLDFWSRLRYAMWIEDTSWNCEPELRNRRTNRAECGRVLLMPYRHQRYSVSTLTIAY
jgi:hypothetical protein